MKDIDTNNTALPRLDCLKLFIKSVKYHHTSVCLFVFFFFANKHTEAQENNVIFLPYS